MGLRFEWQKDKGKLYDVGLWEWAWEWAPKSPSTYPLWLPPSSAEIFPSQFRQFHFSAIDDSRVSAFLVISLSRSILSSGSASLSRDFYVELHLYLCICCLAYNKFRFSIACFLSRRVRCEFMLLNSCAFNLRFIIAIVAFYAILFFCFWIFVAHFLRSYFIRLFLPNVWMRIIHLFTFLEARIEQLGLMGSFRLVILY